MAAFGLARLELAPFINPAACDGGLAGRIKPGLYSGSHHRLPAGCASGVAGPDALRLAGTALALAAVLSRLGEDLIDAPIQMARTLPFLALVPLFILWFGIGETPKIALVALGALFPLYLNLHAGIRGTDPKLTEAAFTLGLSRAALVRHVILPAALPNALTGLRYAIGIAWLSLVVGEQINADAGIGYLITNATCMDAPGFLVVEDDQ